MTPKQNAAEQPPAILLGGRPAPTLPAAIAAGRHPRVEYLCLTEQYGFDLAGFDDAARAAPWVRLASKRAGPYWGLAALARANPRRWRSVLTTGEDVGLPLALLQRLTAGRLPVSILTHGSYLGSRKGAWALRLLRGASHVRFLCLSESLRERLIHRHGIPAGRVVTVGYGVDTAFFQPAPGAGVPRQIASAGMAMRDYRTLAAAVTGLDVSVKIAADSAWFQTETDIAGRILPPNVEARSYGDYVGLRRLYAESAFVVVPLYEAVHACGYAVIAEAMAMGKPVITTKIASHSDYIIDGETGFYVPPGDVDALRERIASLLDRPALAAAMGRNARRLIESRYTLEAYSHNIAAAAGMPARPKPTPPKEVSHDQSYSLSA